MKWCIRCGRFAVARAVFVVSAVCLLLNGCAVKERAREEQRSVYYWRTTFALDEVERRFLSEQSIRRMYIRYFDVMAGQQSGGDYEAVPNATIQFRESVPEGLEVVPVVFIVNDVLRRGDFDVKTYAGKLVKRVMAISRAHGIAPVEVQLDCDWTEQTEETFFQLCAEVRTLLAQQEIKISSTIRLHQLVKSPPPVDSGMLMVYNTGAIKSISTENSIFNPEDIKPYLADKRLENYALPLDVAYPVYGWSVCFTSWNEFKCLLHTTDFSDYAGIKLCQDNIYKVEESGVAVEGMHLWRDEMIRVEQPAYSDIQKIKGIIDAKLRKSHSNVIYHLDSKQLSNYTENEIEHIFD